MTKTLICTQGINHVTTTGKRYEVVREDAKWWTIVDDEGLRYYILKGSCPNWKVEE